MSPDKSGGVNVFFGSNFNVVDSGQIVTKELDKLSTDYIVELHGMYCCFMKIKTWSIILHLIFVYVCLGDKESVYPQILEVSRIDL